MKYKKDQKQGGNTAVEKLTSSTAVAGTDDTGDALSPDESIDESTGPFSPSAGSDAPKMRPLLEPLPPLTLTSTCLQGSLGAQGLQQQQQTRTVSNTSGGADDRRYHSSEDYPSHLIDSSDKMVGDNRSIYFDVASVKPIEGSTQTGFDGYSVTPTPPFARYLHPSSNAFGSYYSPQDFWSSQGFPSMTGTGFMTDPMATRSSHIQPEQNPYVQHRRYAQPPHTSEIGTRGSGVQAQGTYPYDGYAPIISDQQFRVTGGFKEEK